MLEQLLKYHQNLVSTEFVEKLKMRIEQQCRLRNLILGSFTLLGIAAGVIGFAKVWPNNLVGYTEQYDELSIVLFSCLLAGFGAFLFWVMNDEFESP